MNNLWEFLLQTISVSLVAALLLAVKWLLNDKLSPRWQYAVWSILALRILLPAAAARYILLPAPLWVEALKAMAEQGLDSAYSAAYAPLSMEWPIPLVQGSPQSVTDWLFLVYAAGVLVTVLWHFLAFFRLRLLLWHSPPASEEVRRQIELVCEKYGLKGCAAVSVEGLPSAFVCGVFRPVLAVPAGKTPDEKVLLHELLHLKHGDALQSMFWCLLRALHWCNPFLHCVFDRVGNDMEALCDQRALERLEGEERREYGGILLDMANQRYPRAPGTTSISNGGKNISRRIAAIVRFRKYPRGMALVSVCVALVLASPSLLGAAVAQDTWDPRPGSQWQLNCSLALARIQRCSTPAGALDTYARGLMYENGIYLAAASPLSKQQAMAEAMAASAEDGEALYHIGVWDEGTAPDQEQGYYVYNLEPSPEGGYEGLLSFGLLVSSGEGQQYREGAAMLVPVTVRQEDGWVVEENGDPQEIPYSTSIRFPGEEGPWVARYEAAGESGTVEVTVRTVYAPEVEGFYGGILYDDGALRAGAAFSHGILLVDAEYRFGGTEEQRRSLDFVGIEVTDLSDPDRKPVFLSTLRTGSGATGGSSGLVRSWDSMEVGDDWDGTVTSGGGGSADLSEEGLIPFPPGFGVRVFWNGEPKEDFILTEAEE
ncbi:MAG: M56 family metallopeptidase [Bacillota bacterium]|nr:M56 family metallopeptidase [Bacillota bacterium]